MNEIRIAPSTINQIAVIFELYDAAIAYQKQVGNNHWLGFERSLVEQEIREGRHFLIWNDEILLGTFCFTLNDPIIWQERNTDPAIYLHRIATNESARGMNLVPRIIEWARLYAEVHGLQYIRLDTGAGNERLLKYYVRCGFSYLGDTDIEYSEELPMHYKDAMFALFQMAV